MANVNNDSLSVDFLINKEQAEAAIKKLRGDLDNLSSTAEKAQKVLSKPITFTDSFAGTGISQRSRDIDAVIRRLQQSGRGGTAPRAGESGIVGQTAQSILSGTGGLGGALLAGFIGGGIAAIPAAIGQITSAISAFSEASKDAFLQFQRGTRILQAQSIETGIKFDILAEKAAKFGEVTALSTGKSREVFGQLANFARAAGQTDKLDKFTKAFTDLAAARGINPEQLGDIARQLNALVDEATDKLLNANPSAFFDQYAKSIGKTAGQLTDAEKRAAVFNAVIERGNLFVGAASSKFDEAGGASLRFNKAVEDLKESFGRFIVEGGDFTIQFGKAYTPFIDKAIITTSAFGELLDVIAGKSDKSIGEIVQNAIDATNRANQARIAESPLFKAIATDAERRAANEQFQKELADFQKRVKDLQIKQAAALAGTDNSPEGLALKKIGAQVLTGFKITDAASLLQARKDLDAKIQEQIRLNKETAEKVAKDAEKVFSTGNRGLIRIARREFERVAGGIGDFAERSEIFERFRKAIVESFEKDVEKAGKDIQKLRAVFKDVFFAPDVDLSDKNTILAKINKAIADSIREATQKVDELRKSAGALFDEQRARLTDNPFIKLAQSSAAAFERIKTATKGFSDDVRNLFFRIQEQIDSIERARARIETRTQAAELESEALALKSPTGEIVERRLRDRIRQAGFDIQANGDLINESQRAALEEFIKNERERLTAEEETARRRQLIQAKIDAAESSVSAGEQRLADQAIIAATRGVDLQTLTPEQRRAAIDAREREAARLRSAEADAMNLTREQTTLQQRIAETVENLFKVAKERGVDAVVKIIDETNGRIEQRVVKRPSSADTARILEQ